MICESNLSGASSAARSDAAGAATAGTRGTAARERGNYAHKNNV